MAESKQVIIIGGGVTGTALLYTLAEYTNVKDIMLFEKHDKPGQVASHHSQNSQTLHFGDIETNYSFEKAKSVSAGATLVKNYLDTHDKDKLIHSIFPKMILAVGKAEVKALRERYEQFKELFPHSQLLERNEITQKEPLIVKGRNQKEEILAMWTPLGYTVDYERLSESFVNKVQVKNRKDISINFSTEIKKIERKGKLYYVYTKNKTFKTEVLIVDAGAMSIKFAKDLGYGEHLSIFSVAGNFYSGPQVLNSKVYTMQLAKLPFAAVHGDPDVRAKGYTRFGPSAKVLVQLERRNPKTIKHYFQTFKFNMDGFKSIFKIAGDPTYLGYMVKNYLYEIPYFGTRLFAKNAQKIVPTIKKNQIKKDKGYGGTRPQIINTKTKTIDMGEARLEGKNAIFNITPSPGASTCLDNGVGDTRKILGFLKGKFALDEEKLQRDLMEKTY